MIMIMADAYDDGDDDNEDYGYHDDYDDDGYVDDDDYDDEGG